MRSRRADSVSFGFDFQVNAAIVLMLENIKQMQYVRVEGENEDIELKLSDGKSILAQAKSVVKSSSDFKNVRNNLKKGLISLSEGAQKVDVKQLIFITNSPNPFNDDESRSIFWGPSRRNYDTLPPSAQKIVADYLVEISSQIDPAQLTIQVLPFETDDERERYKVVQQEIDNFIGSLNVSLSPGLSAKLLRVWQNDIFINGTKKDATIRIDKKSAIWPIIVLETDINHCDDKFLEQFDVGVYEEVTRQYESVINSCCERVEFFTKILYDYAKYECPDKKSNKHITFINDEWRTYSGELKAADISDEVLEALTKIVLYNVIRRRITIDKIKREVSL